MAEHERSREALKEADSRKDEFLALLAHELRSPLAPIHNAVQILHQEGAVKADRLRARDVIDRQVQQMARLVDDLLDVSRITRGKIELRKERVELAAVVQSALEASRPLIESCGHQLTVVLPPRPVFLDIDPTRLAQVLSNLLNNAAKYTEPGGRISLTAEQDGGEAVFKVRDNGIGIPAALLPRIFEMFTQVDSSLERTQGGLGIGLALARRLVEMHGGTIEAHSGGTGQGSELIVRCPAAVGPLRPEKRPRAKERATMAGASGCRVLVVDDNRDSVDSLRLLLELRGYEVSVAYDGLEAVAAAEAFAPRLVLLDIGLPRMNGYDAARRIREQPWGRDVMLVALTGWGQEEDKRRSEAAGFNVHLTKPLDPTVLERLLATVVA
jgi:CheY-like chemotaxis protein/two-component sensor histidine kinase